jgi:uncharacterized heparinase superfamily protein
MAAPNHVHSVRKGRITAPVAEAACAAIETLQTLWYRGPVHRITLLGRVPAAIHAQIQEPWPGDSAHGRLLIDSRFVWNGHTAQLVHAHAQGPSAFNWTPANLPVEGQAALHGFAWLRDLRAVGGDVARATARAHAADWIATQSAWTSLSFRPDVLAARVAAWLAHYDFLVVGGDAASETTLRNSLARQVRHLNHLRLPRSPAATRIAILKGLIYAEALLFGPGKRLTQVLARLGAELAEQIRPDGGHVSRSPERQLTVLRDLIDIRSALRAADAEVPDAVTQAIDRMAPMLRFFRHGDGALTLFNDSHETESWLIDVVLTQSEARGKPLTSAPHSGFERAQAGRALLIVDAGAPEQKAADCAFAGTLALEFGVGKERLIVNCGAGPADEPQWAAALRATAAHSTLTLAEANSTEIAFSIRGARYRSRVRAVTGNRDEADGAIWIERSHDGYARRYGFLHRRKIYLAAGGDDVRGEDSLVPAPDGVGARHRRKARPFMVRFHLHPGVQATLLQDGAVLLRLPSGLGWRFAARGGDVRIDESIYFGGATPRRTRQLVIEGRTGSDGAAVKWALRRVPERGTEPTAAKPGEEA